MRFEKDLDYFDLALEGQERGERLVFVAYYEDAPAGYCILSWSPKYAFFRKMGFPEVQDLNVLPAFRRKGIASAMIAHCEKLAQGRACEYMGIGVGLDSSYGPAQRLYIKLGYVPDGNGVTYDRMPIAKGEMRPVDDDLSLMMVKVL